MDLIKVGHGKKLHIPALAKPDSSGTLCHIVSMGGHIHVNGEGTTCKNCLAEAERIQRYI